MFDKNYYCLVAGLREYTLDSEKKGFDAREIVNDILAELSKSDAEAVRLLYGYYDCENIIAMRSGRAAFNALGNFSREELADAFAEVAEGLSALLETGCAPYVFFDTMPDAGALEALSALPAEAPLRMAALLHAHAPETLTALARRWHAPNAFADALTAEGIRHDFSYLPTGNTRINVKIRHGMETDLNCQGPDIPKSAIEAFYEKLKALRAGDLLILAGSVIAGVLIFLGGKESSPVENTLREVFPALSYLGEITEEGGRLDLSADISSDISVLNTMLAQEGLKEDGLKGK